MVQISQISYAADIELFWRGVESVMERILTPELTSQVTIDSRTNHSIELHIISAYQHTSIPVYQHAPFIFHWKKIVKKIVICCRYGAVLMYWLQNYMRILTPEPIDHWLQKQLAKWTPHQTSMQTACITYLYFPLKKQSSKKSSYAADMELFWSWVASLMTSYEHYPGPALQMSSIRISTPKKYRQKNRHMLQI